MSRPRLVYVPGGPGFSSHHEAAVLGPMLRERGWSATFWNEPWRGLADVPVDWDAYVDALAATIAEASEEHLTVVGHSAAVHAAAAAINVVKPRDCRLVLVAPTFSLHDCTRAIAKLAAQGLGPSAPDQAERMLAAAARSQSLFDVAAQEALTIAATDTTLFSRYWCNAAAFSRYAETTAAPDSGFDLNTFVGLFAQLDARSWSLPDRPGVTGIVVILGADDPIVSASQASAEAARWAGLSMVQVFPGCGHWPHLEAPDRFYDVLEASRRA